MTFKSINPATGEAVAQHPAASEAHIEQALARAAAAAVEWAALPVAERSRLLRAAAAVLRERNESLARLITLEMGKLLREARAEVEKCATVLEFYAQEGPAWIADEPVGTDASRSYVSYAPLGTILAVMPWNFPFWQVFRFAAPALVAGNTALLKHAANVHLCALAIQEVFDAAGFPPGVFQNLLIGAERVAGVIHDPRVHAVSLTGSEAAGRKVAAVAGAALKKSVMELGGSDPFVVLADADLDFTIPEAVRARFTNAGQTCIAGKRFIVAEAIADEFVARLRGAIEQLRPGDPLDDGTTLAPLARADQREALHRQVTASVAAGARLVTGGGPLDRPGFFYAPTLLDRVVPGMPAYHEELFGPVALVLRARDETEALRLANDTPFGLGGSVWTRDSARGESLVRQIECGCAFVNGVVKSDPRLPFGGVKASGFGRELSHFGLREFVNARTVWVR
jgi:succinate-semialdehyde dehydrogenase/glutarate-semialdehyde dehydrogenase